MSRKFVYYHRGGISSRVTGLVSSPTQPHSKMAPVAAQSVVLLSLQRTNGFGLPPRGLWLPVCLQQEQCAWQIRSVKVRGFQVGEPASHSYRSVIQRNDHGDIEAFIVCLQSIMLSIVICTVRRVYLFCKKLIGCQVLVLTQGMQLPIRGPVWDVRQKQDKLNGGVDISSSKDRCTAARAPDY